MDIGSLDFETWRLVGLGFLTLGALATVFAIVAIIIMFRDGGTDDGRRYTRAQWDDDDDEDDIGDRDEDDDLGDRDEDDDDRDVEDLRTKVTAGPTSRERDSGPSSTALGLGLNGPRESLFTVPASDSPRQPIRSTRDEPHVPSPDWYEYADVADAKPVGDLDDDLVEALEATRQAEPPAAQSVLPVPPVVPPASPTPTQSVAPERSEPRRRASRWFEDSAGTENADAAPAPAVSPVKFPWEQTPAQTSAAPERPVVPQRREEPQQPAEAYAEPADTSAIEAVPVAPSRHSDTRTATPEPSPRQETQQPTAERYADRADTSVIAAVPAATARPSEPRTAAPDPATPNPVAREEREEREDSDSPTADWYDDPDGSGGERWWDGKGWTRHRRPRSGSPTTTDSGRLRAARPQAAPPTSDAARRSAPADTQGGQSASRAPGWYRDPSGSGERRFWDGSRWTNGT